MSSLPQGWLSHTDPPRRSLSGKSEFVSAVPTLRKKWNSPQSFEKPTPLPPRKSSLAMLPNGMPSKITPPRNSAKPSSSTSLKTQTAEGPKSSIAKRDFMSEINNLKKEISTYKSENTVLKARVRKLEDENGQKSRQVTKLKAEIQNETVNQRRNKETETVTVLRQKVLRLENSLKEKDQNIKRMVTEMNNIKVDELREILVKYHKQFGLNTNGLGSDFFKKHKLLEPCTGGLTPAPKTTKSNTKDVGSRMQVDRLRNMVHKLETENQTLQQQIKDRDLEIRRLKLQISRQGSRAQTTPSRSQTSSTARLAPSSSSTSFSRTSTTRIPSSGQIGTLRSTRSTPTPATRTQSKSTVLPRVPAAQRTMFSMANQAVPKQKPRMMPGKMAKADSMSDIERRAQILRENNAARKIQQGWRNHRKMMSRDSGLSEEEKALRVLSTELVSHSKRLQNISFFDEDSPTKSKTLDSEELFSQDVKTLFRSLFCENSYT